jgi:hypothetical protein
MENCRLGKTVGKIGTQYRYRLLLEVDASADFSPNERPKWSMLDDVLDRVRVKLAFKLMLLGLLILVSSSSAVLAESANSDFKRG